MEKINRFSFLEEIDRVSFSKPGADQYRLWLAHYCGALRSRLTSSDSQNSYTREQNQRALLVGLDMERHVITLELKIFQDWIHNSRT